ncbi:hypothetical protein L7F22_013946 [Adiantum nelumboides]|nr:hypothetical protein [Adiantum nelumboides]
MRHNQHLDLFKNSSQGISKVGKPLLCPHSPLVSFCRLSCKLHPWPLPLMLSCGTSTVRALNATVNANSITQGDPYPIALQSRERVKENIEREMDKEKLAMALLPPSKCSNSNIKKQVKSSNESGHASIKTWALIPMLHHPNRHTLLRAC